MNEKDAVRNRKRYTDDEKQEAIRLVREKGVSLSQAALEKDIHPSMLYRWIRKYNAGHDDGNGSAGVLKSHERELRSQRTEIKNLKRSVSLMRNVMCKILKEKLPEILENK